VLSDDLLELQRLDTALDQLGHRMATLPERAAAEAAAVELRRNQARLARLDVRLGELSSAVEQAEQNGAAILKHRGRLEAQLKTVIAPREAEALMHELDTLAAQRDTLDDNELALLEEQSEVLDETDAARAATPALQAADDEARAALSTVTIEGDRDAASMRAQRAEVAAGVEPTVLADYERRREHFHGVAISKVEGRRCGGCRMDLSTSEYEQLVAATPPGSVGDCPQCGRMLVP
jgi:uncharacterized protein